MTYFLWVVVSVIAYIGGVVIILRVTPRIMMRSFDEGLFMAIAALDIIGALLAFGAVVVTFALFNGAIWIRILDVLLLSGIILVGVRMALLCLNPRFTVKTVKTSRIIAGVYCVCLALAALYYIVQMFLPTFS
jgi:hypothetical protein